MSELNLQSHSIPACRGSHIGFGKGGKDRHFDIPYYVTVMQAEQSAYEKIYELTSGPKDTIKSVHETSTWQFDFYNKWEGLTILCHL